MPNSTAGRAKRQYDPQRTRRSIVEAAAAQFQARGYHASSMHEIMQIAGVPGGSMYHYFPTKKSLALAVISETVAASVRETWIEPVRSGKNARDAILSVFDAVAGQIERDGRGVTGCPVNNLTLELSLADSDFQTALRAIFDEWTTAIADCIRAGFVAGAAPQADPQQTATAVVAAFSGAMAIAKARQSAEPIRICARATARLLAG